jgi:SAM-dependent methyltransferase
MGRDVRSVEDLLRVLDGVFAGGGDRWGEEGAGWWDGFYADRGRGIPFFVEKPDENLVSYVEGGPVAPGRALELGCGPGRNALYLARAGFEVDAVDLSAAALEWARSRAEVAGAAVRFHRGNVFDPQAVPLHGTYDLVFDSGCFHHLPPHRRISYLALLDRHLAPGGHFGLSCFASGQMGSELPDADFYRDGTLHGGLAYRPDDLRRIFADLTEVEIRPMRDEPADSPHFGEPFLHTALFRRP